MRVRRAVAAAVGGAVIVTCGAVLAFTGDDDGPLVDPHAAAETVAQSTWPPSQPCEVGDSATPLELSWDEARAATTAAARALRRRQSEEALARALTPLLDDRPGVAATVAAAVSGAPGAPRLTCYHPRDPVDPEKMRRSGLTPRAERLRAAWTEVFGALPAGGFGPGGVHGGHVDGSSHYDGRAIDVFFRPLDDRQQRRLGWVFAQWLVAHAGDYDVLSVIYADHIWTSWASAVGWRDYVHPSGNRRNPVLRHLDHVHVAVESGRPWRG